MKAAFDNSAEGYDLEFSNTSIGRAQRSLVWKYVAPKLKNHWEVLELTAGTGVDARWLSKKVKSVHVTDQSSKMVHIARKNTKESNLTFQELDANKVESLGERYNLVFSNFGGLNCLSVADWQRFSKDVKQVLMPNGELIFVLISSSCWWERIYFTLKADSKNAARRSLGFAEAKLGEITLPIWYYSPKEIYQFFDDEFELINQAPIGFCVPPSYLQPRFKNMSWLIDIFYQIDQLLLRIPFLSNKADHFLIHLKKNS